MKMSNKVYDVLVWIALYGLPALATLVFTISQIWGIPYGEEIQGTIIAVDTALGIWLGISKHQYNRSQSDTTLK